MKTSFVTLLLSDYKLRWIQILIWLLISFVHVDGITAQGEGGEICNCAEYLYLNDTGTGEVHKFSIDPTDGTMTEVGSPWMSGFTNPHGLGSDLNGNIYIGDNTTGPI